MPDTDLRIVVDGYRQLARLGKTGRVYFLPVDIRSATPADHYSRLLRLVDHCRIQPFIPDSVLRQTADQWTPVNSTAADNPFRPAYDTRDWGRVLELFGGEYPPALTYLSSCWSTLFPFLRSVGYQDEDLSWVTSRL